MKKTNLLLFLAIIIMISLFNPIEKTATEKPWQFG